MYTVIIHRPPGRREYVIYRPYERPRSKRGSHSGGATKAPLWPPQGITLYIVQGDKSADSPTESNAALEKPPWRRKRPAVTFWGTKWTPPHNRVIWRQRRSGTYARLLLFSLRA